MAEQKDLLAVASAFDSLPDGVQLTDIPGRIYHDTVKQGGSTEAATLAFSIAQFVVRLIARAT